ncbi:EamA family transporter [Sphingorhabdus lutea]|uniref:EamA family transporter n=2 Tax=Sphingorhabdus lutea TaxID=1913578 RepID=A0A1L3JE42_9SPHN|nr:EamA family transporter [Sphingorhabdus lutea]
MNNNQQHQTPAAIAFSVACAGIAFFSLMDAAMKVLSIEMGAYNAVLWRNIFGAGMGGALFLGARNKWPSMANLKIHLWRSLVVALMAVAFFWAIARLPLAEAIGLSFFAPVVALYLAVIILKESVGKAAIWASIFGLAGVSVILIGKFSGKYDDDAIWGVAAVLLSACLFAYNLILARQQAQKAGPIEIAFFQSLLTCFWLLLAAPWFLVMVTNVHIPLLAGAGFLAMISLLMLSWAYARAEAQILIPVEYTAFIWAAAFGWYFFDEAVTPTTIAGTVLIVMGSVVAAHAKPKLIEQPDQISI